MAGRPKSELVHAVQTAMSFYEAVGRRPPVSLRRLQEEQQTVPEKSTAGPRLPEQVGNECVAGDIGNNNDSKDALTQEAASACQSSEETNCETQTHEGGSAIVFVSTAHQALDPLREGSAFQSVDEAPSSRSRLVVLALALALAVGLGWRYATLPIRRTYGQVLAKVVKNDISNKPQLPAEARNASTASAGQPSARVGTVPAPARDGQGSSGSELLHTDETQPQNAEISQSLQDAALSGNASAQFELGNAYALGRDVPADPVIGYTWLTIAFANGDRQAESLIRQLTQQLSQSQIAQIRWNVGEMYANGVGIHRDKITAYMWYLLAELEGEKRSTTAMSSLAATMTSDELSEASARASRWLRRHRIGLSD